MNRFSAFINELKRRRVFRVAVVYGGVAFVVVQIVDGAFGYLHIPEWFGSAIIVLVLVGFPFAVGLAWVFDITPEGIVRTGKSGGPAALRRAQGDGAGGTAQGDGVGGPALPGSGRRRPDRSGQVWRGEGKPLTSNRALIAVAVVAVAFGVWGPWGGGGDDLPIIAVLPFQSYSAEEDDWFADGFTDVLTTQLAKLSDIGVIARTSTMHYKKTDLTASEVGRELGASVVLEGSVLRSGGKVRITSQLIDTRTDRHLWSENYERRMEDVIALQSDVAFAIAQALKEKLTPEEARIIVALPTANAAAYEHYLKAISLDQDLGLHPPTSPAETIDRRIAIIRELEQAITLDPAFAEVHYRLVIQHGRMYANQRGADATPQRLALLTQALNRAEAGAPGTPPVRMARGVYHYLSNREYRRALEYFEPLLALAPNDPEIMRWVGNMYRRLGRWDEGLELLARAADLSPRDPRLATIVLETYRLLHRYDEAERYFERLKFMGATERYQARGWMAVESRGDLEEAWAIFLEGRKELGPGPLDGAMINVAIYRDDLDAAQEIVRISPTFTRADSLRTMTWIHWLKGDKRLARETGRAFLSTMLSDREIIKSYVDYRRLAIVAAAIGDRALVTQWADTALMMMNPAIDAVVGPIHLSVLAIAYFLNRDLERGLDLMEESQAHPNNHTIYDIQHLREYDVVRDHPRYIALMERLRGGR